MQRFERVLFVNDPGANAGPAFQCAVRLAAANGAQLSVIEVGEALPRTLSSLQKAFTS